ncbi:MAG: lysophospholipid acyltransferase family protein [Desulfobacterota bacterium]|nr:lysophospholipid acyltransferase family protein [Thermodesulfobacteriota bacterium]
MIQVLSWLITTIFYRMEIIGEGIPEGPVLLVMNHPNALLDPAVLLAGSRRPVRFLAKSTLFTRSPLGGLVRQSGAIPVYRPRDSGAAITQNVIMFADVQEALGRGQAVGLFPEGISHSSGRLEPLRTGAARIALEAFREGIPLRLVPVGINYERKTLFRSRVTLMFGTPFSGTDLLKNFQTDPPGAVRLLTERISERLRSLIVEADPRFDADLVARADRLYAAARGLADKARERIERRQTIARGLERLRTENPALYERLWLKMRAYDRRLHRLKLNDRILETPAPTSVIISFILRETLWGLLLLPLCLGGFLVWSVPYYATDAFIRLTKPSPDVTATYKALSGGVFHLSWFTLLLVGAGVLSGWTRALLVFFLAPLVGILALFAIERETEILETVKIFLAARLVRQETLVRFRKGRNELADLMEEAYRWLQAGSSN